MFQFLFTEMLFFFNYHTLIWNVTKSEQYNAHVSVLTQVISDLFLNIFEVPGNKKHSIISNPNVTASFEPCWPSNENYFQAHVIRISQGTKKLYQALSGNRWKTKQKKNKKEKPQHNSGITGSPSVCHNVIKVPCQTFQAGHLPFLCHPIQTL